MRILDFAHAMEYVSKGGQEDQVRRGQDPAKRQQERLEQWLQAQGHELKTGEVEKVLAVWEQLRTLRQERGQWGAVET